MQRRAVGRRGRRATFPGRWIPADEIAAVHRVRRESRNVRAAKAAEHVRGLWKAVIRRCFPKCPPRAPKASGEDFRSDVEPAHFLAEGSATVDPGPHQKEQGDRQQHNDPPSRGDLAQVRDEEGPLDGVDARDADGEEPKTYDRANSPPTLAVPRDWTEQRKIRMRRARRRKRRRSSRP